MSYFHFPLSISMILSKEVNQSFEYSKIFNLLLYDFTKERVYNFGHKSCFHFLTLSKPQ